MKKILLILITVTSFISFSQEKFLFKDISNYSKYTVKDTVWSVPDYSAEYRIGMYDGEYNQPLEEFTIEYENLQKELKNVEKLDRKQRKVKRKVLKEKKRNILAKFRPTFNALKAKGHGYKHFVGVNFITPNQFGLEVVNPKLLEASKSELEKIQGEVVSLKTNSEISISSKTPRKKVRFKRLLPLVSDSGIKGEYYIAKKIMVSRENDAQQGTYEYEVLTDSTKYGYSTYTYFKSVQGDGVDFYNNNIDVYDEYTVTRKPKPLTAKEKNIIGKMKIYKGQMIALVDKMAQYRSNTLVAREATKNGQALQKKVNSLYGNDDDKYYDFVQLLDMNTKEVMNEFNQVLRGSVILFGL